MKITRKGYYTITGPDGQLLTRHDGQIRQVTSRDECYERITDDGRDGTYTIHCPEREVEVGLILGPGGGGDGGGGGGGGSETYSGNELFLDKFDYVADEGTTYTSATDNPFTNSGPWYNVKAINTNESGARGYISTETSIPGYAGTIPGSSGRVCRMRFDGAGGQTDCYLGTHNVSSAALGTIPADVWLQYWIFINDDATEPSAITGPNKWLYPNNNSAGYPGSVDTDLSWLQIFRNMSGETDGTAWNSAGDTSAETFMYLEAHDDADYADATGLENDYKIGWNQNETTMPFGQWVLVKQHFDMSGTQGSYEEWHKTLTGSFVKKSEWIGGVTTNFDWTLQSFHNNGHRALRVGTTFDDDVWLYLADFCLAANEADLPTYSYT